MTFGSFSGRASLDWHYLVLSSGAHRTLPEVAATFRGSATVERLARSCTTILSSLNHSPCVSKGHRWIHPLPLPEHPPWYSAYLLWPHCTSSYVESGLEYNQQSVCKMSANSQTRRALSEGGHQSLTCLLEQREKETDGSGPIQANSKEQRQEGPLSARRAEVGRCSLGLRARVQAVNPEGRMSTPRPSVLGRRGSSPREGTRPCSSC